ncbi:vWA domain-containing protein [Corynebacterium heidelbergense]|uniref:VWFA domain-containing protein n=1 Tax=Corynebacterium heidelbergense TaxID=2055947 RepID=A0A364VAG1_9CORY|nr:vWA domain-containing protein [Corynebacterium heidelbergense]RAV33601.1 hypothetical protein CWC39_07575 [Corynebacterium heidelbergense]WCZ36490.1 von Willebrand factor type A domain protein [Corynebacterium heidelbergense]
MGRHATGKRRQAVAPWVWFALLAFLVLCAILAAWTIVSHRNDQDLAATSCPEGSYDLEVWSAPQLADSARTMANEYNRTGPVVQDKCVNAHITPIADEEAMRTLEDQGVKAPAWVPADPRAAVAAAQGSAIAINGQNAPVLGQVSGQDAPLLLLGSASQAPEQATRSAADFAQFAGSRQGAKTVPLTDLGVVPLPDAPNPAPAATPPAADPGRPLALAPRTGVTYLLDTSGSMGLMEGNPAATRLDNVRGPLAQQMTAVGRAGGTVGLWNYSSPLSRSARTPFRDNVDISVGDNGSTSAEVLKQLGVGGATHTYQSVLASYNAAVAEAKAHGTAQRVVLITDGPNDGGTVDLPNAVAELQRMHGDAPVRLDVVAVGNQVDGPALEQLAGAAGGAVHPVPDTAAPHVQEGLAAALA